MFAPGHGGDATQIEQIISQVWSIKAPFDFFSIDHNREFSGLCGDSLADQGHFLNDAVRLILQLYNASHSDVIMIGHSMGGIAIRNMLTLPEFRPGTVKAILTISAPHAGPVIAFDPALLHIYHNMEATPPPDDVSIISFMPGHNDRIVSTEKARLPKWGTGQALAVPSASIPGRWWSPDHNAVLRCDILGTFIAKALLAHFEGDAMVSATQDRLEAVESLLGRRGEFFRPPVEPRQGPVRTLTISGVDRRLFVLTNLQFGQDFYLGSIGTVRREQIPTSPTSADEQTALFSYAFRLPSGQEKVVVTVKDEVHVEKFEYQTKKAVETLSDIGYGAFGREATAQGQAAVPQSTILIPSLEIGVYRIRFSRCPRLLALKIQENEQESRWFSAQCDIFLHLSPNTRRGTHLKADIWCDQAWSFSIALDWWASLALVLQHYSPLIVVNIFQLAIIKLALKWSSALGLFPRPVTYGLVPLAGLLATAMTLNLVSFGVKRGGVLGRGVGPVATGLIMTLGLLFAVVTMEAFGLLFSGLDRVTERRPMHFSKQNPRVQWTAAAITTLVCLAVPFQVAFVMVYVRFSAGLIRSRSKSLTPFFWLLTVLLVINGGGVAAWIKNMRVGWYTWDVFDFWLVWPLALLTWALDQEFVSLEILQNLGDRVLLGSLGGAMLVYSILFGFEQPCHLYTITNAAAVPVLLLEMKNRLADRRRGGEGASSLCSPV